MSLRERIAAVLSGEVGGSCIGRDEVVSFFPTCGFRNERGQWVVPIHGWLYEPGEQSRLRRAAIRLIERTLDLRAEGKDFHALRIKTTVRHRLGLLLADNERFERVKITLCDGVHIMGRSHANGHFEGEVIVADERPAGMVDFAAVVRSGDRRTFSGCCHLLEDHGTSVISDIDDTIKITGVGDRSAMLKNTFIETFADVPGMAQLYGRLAQAHGAAFHYVSASPWSLYPLLSAFAVKADFPLGSWHLRNLRLWGRDLRHLFTKSAAVKKPAIEKILQTYPRRKFVLVGDAGEHDAAIYTEMARKYAPQVLRILIRRNRDVPAIKGVEYFDSPDQIVV